MFFQTPFFCIANRLWYINSTDSYVGEIVSLCRNEAWAALQARVCTLMDEISDGLQRFYREKIPPRQQSEPELSFHWSSFQKNSQRCYSIAHDLILDINGGRYPAGTLLPPLEKLAKDMGVSFSTVRRAVSLLGSIGRTRSTPKVGTLVLPYDDCTKNCDFTQPALRRRLIDFVYSQQILALSIREVADLTIRSLDADALNQWRALLAQARDMGRYDLAVYTPILLIVDYAPYQTLRTVYRELCRQLIWGQSIRGLQGTQAERNDLWRPALDALTACLEKKDAATFSSVMEDILIRDLRDNVEQLLRLGIREVEELLIPEPNSAPLT